MVSHAGTALPAEVADRVGSTAAFSAALDALRQRRCGHDPGRGLVNVAVGHGRLGRDDIDTYRGSGSNAGEWSS